VKVLAPLDCTGAPKAPPEETYQLYFVLATGVVTVIVLVVGDVQVFRLVPVKIADGGAVTVIALLIVVSIRHPQLFLSTNVTGYTALDGNLAH
jgi:hypothetical protein